MTGKPSPETGRQLLDGSDISTWPRLKVERAWGHFNDLFSRVSVWNASRAYTADVRVSDDRQYLELISGMGLRPPLEEWSLLAADAVHNLRTSLDSMAWELAHLDGKTLARPQRIKFPVTHDEEAWRRDLKILQEDYEPFVVDRLHRVQPWQDSPEPPASHWLHLLNRLDNDDKHRGSLSAVPVGESIEVVGMQVLLAGESSAQDWQFWAGSVDEGLPPGSLIARVGFGRTIQGEAVLPANAHVSLVPAFKTEVGLVPVAAVMHEALPYVNRVMHLLRTGRLPEPPQQPANEQA